MELSLRLTYYYCVLTDNLEHYTIHKEKCGGLLEKNMKLLFKEGCFYSEEYADYMDSQLFII